MTATPIPAGVLTVDDERKGSMFALRVGGEVVAWCNGYGRRRLLAGPARPDGVPEHAVAAVLWFGPENEHQYAQIYLPDGTNPWDIGAQMLRESGVPVLPYQPALDPADGPTEPLVHRRKSLMGDRWAWCDPSITEHLTGDQENVTCPECIEKVERFRAQRDADRHTSAAAPVAPTDPGYEPHGEPCSICGGTTRATTTCPRCRAWRVAAAGLPHGTTEGDQPDPDPEALLVEKITADWTHPDPAAAPTECEACADGSPCAEHLFDTSTAVVPPVAGERTGPLGLNEGDRVQMVDGSSAETFIRARGEGHDNGERLWRYSEHWEPVRDARPQPAETIADIDADSARVILHQFSEWIDSEADRVSGEATHDDLIDMFSMERSEAARPHLVDPDPDTIPVNRDHFHNLGVVASIAHEFAAAMAAAGLPQEPTEPEPTEPEAQR